MAKKPHIVIFNPDQMRADALHHLGNPASITPNLDSIAANDAVSFRNAFCQNPVCTPSRCSFLTGLYPHTYGQRTISHMLHDNQSSLLMELKNAGYYVWMNGRNDFLPAQKPGIFDKHATETYFGGNVQQLGPEDPNIKGELGSDSFYSFYNGKLKVNEQGVNYSSDDDSVDAAIDRIKNRPADQPLCIFLGLLYPHPPYQIEEPYFSAIDRSKLPPRILPPESWEGKPSMVKGLFENFGMQGWTEERWDELRAVYLGMCMKVDYLFGKLCQALKDEGIYDDTAIFFFSDHGDYTGNYGIVEKNQNTFEDCLTNVPFLIKPPKGIEVDAGVSDGMVELVDFYATAIELAGVEPDHTHFGKSLLQVIKDRSKEHREYVFCEGGRLLEERHCSEASDVGGLNPYFPYYPRISLQASEGPEHGKATMLRSKKYKYVRRLFEKDEFYDLENDPMELHNRIDDPEYSNIINEFRINMLDWYQTTCDIVPFKQDSRFTIDRLVGILGDAASPEKIQKIKDLMEEGVPTQHIMGMLRKL